MSDTSIGQRFSHVYLRRDELLQDSARARRRIAAWLASQKDAEGLGQYLVGELGIDILYGMTGVLWAETLSRFSKPDFLDSITLVFRYFELKRQRNAWNPDLHTKFLKACRRIFAEEALCYSIDDVGGVHFKVDPEFAANTTAAIAALGASRYANTRAEFEKGMSALSSATPDGKEAIRGVFGAAEGLYRLMFSKAPKLTSDDAAKNLGGAIQSLYAADAAAQRAARKMVSSFADWIDACHNYRHEQGTEEPSQPPLDLAIEMVSAGAGFVRWLVRFDKHLTQHT